MHRDMSIHYSPVWTYHKTLCTAAHRRPPRKQSASTRYTARLKDGNRFPSDCACFSWSTCRLQIVFFGVSPRLLVRFVWVAAAEEERGGYTGESDAAGSCVRAGGWVCVRQHIRNPASPLVVSLLGATPFSLNRVCVGQDVRNSVSRSPVSLFGASIVSQLQVSSKLYADEREEVTFTLPMLEGLQPLPWRRVEFIYNGGGIGTRLKVLIVGRPRSCWSGRVACAKSCMVSASRTGSAR